MDLDLYYNTKSNYFYEIDPEHESETYDIPDHKPDLIQSHNKFKNLEKIDLTNNIDALIGYLSQ